MIKYTLINEEKHHNFKKGDVIRYEMPSFTSGEYLAKVYHDSKYGFYINQENNFFSGARDWTVININDEDCPKWLLEKYNNLK